MWSAATRLVARASMLATHNIWPKPPAIFSQSFLEHQKVDLGSSIAIVDPVPWRQCKIERTAFSSQAQVKNGGFFLDRYKAIKHSDLPPNTSNSPTMSHFWSKRKDKGKKTDEPKPTSISSPLPNTIQANGNTLQMQLATPASSSTKVRLSLLATAMVDALGGPLEFHSRFSFPFVDSMIPNQNFRLPAGVWTDDTSMTLCLAESISTYKEAPGSQEKGGFDQLHQLELYSRWHQEGYLSAVGRCFDIGDTISQALYIFDSNQPEDALALIESELSAENYSGNGSLMRVLPVGLAYWRDETLAKVYARKSSQTTHPSSMSIEACKVWTGAIAIIMKRTTQTDTEQFSKLSLLEYFANFPYTNSKLRKALASPTDIPQRPQEQSKLEDWFHQHHPLLRLIDETQRTTNESSHKNERFSYTIPPVDKLPSTGYVLHSLLAALYCFFATKTFEDGALLAVNLGSDADTVGAIYAGLAACWYSGDGHQGEGVFWTKRVKEWHKALVKRDLIERVAENLVSFEQQLGQRK